MRFAFLFLLVLNSVWINAQEPRLMLPTGHTDFVNYAAFSSDEKFVITTSYDNSAKVWDLKTGKLVLNLNNGHHDAIWYAAFSSDNTTIITASGDANVIIWNAKTGEIIRILKGHYGAVETAVFTKDNKRVVTASADKTAKVWDVESGKLLFDLRHSGEVYSAILAADESKIITACQDSTAKIWDAKNGKLLTTLYGHKGRLNAASFSPDGEKVLTSAWDERAIVWNWKEKKALFEYRNIHNLKSACFNKNGDLILLTGDSLTCIFNSNNYQIKKIVDCEHLGVNYSAFNNLGNKIIVATEEGRGIVFDLKTNKQSFLYGHTAPIRFAAFSPTGKYCVTVSYDNTAKIWNSNTGSLIYDLSGQTRRLSCSVLSPDKRSMIVTGWDENAKVWNLESGEIEMVLSRHIPHINSAAYSYDSTKVLTLGADGLAKMWDIKTGKFLLSVGKGMQDYSDNSNMIMAGCFSPNNLAFGILYYNGIVEIYRTHNGSLLKTFNIGEPSKLFYNSLEFSPDGSTILTPGNSFEINGSICARYNLLGDKIAFGLIDSAIIILDIKTKAIQHRFSHLGGFVISVRFSSDGKLLTAACSDGIIRMYSLEKGEIIYELKGHTDMVFSSFFTADNNKVVSCSWDGTIKVWNIKDGKLISTMLSFDKSDNIVYTDSFYFKCTKSAATKVYYVASNLKIITFDQLDIKYNRPDKILEALGNTDTALINSYHKAYEKRIKKLGIDTTSFQDGYNVPEADFANRDTINEQRRQQLKLHITGKDSIYLLDRFNVWVNESPLYGLRGISLKNRHTHQFDTTIIISLCDGRNQVETSVTDANGTESYRMPLYVNYVPQKPDSGKLHFIGIGINRFANNQNNLSWSVKDVRDLATSFKAHYGSICTIDTLFDEAVTTDNVTALKKKLRQTGVNDKVIVAYSGHGLLSKDYDYYLSTYNINFSKPEESGLPYDALESLLDSIPARKKLMLIDACHSGEVDKEEMQQYERVQQQLDSTKRGVYLLVNKDAKRIGTKNSFELMQELFVNVGRSTGATIISAAAGTQFALERNNLQNGVFTYSILEYMQQHPHATISDLKKYVNQQVPELTQGAQVPTARSETNSVDWELW